MSTKKHGRDLHTFRKSHDPTFKGASPVAVFQRALRGSATRYIVTCAQNATPVHSDFWKVLLNMAHRLKAELLVVPVRYKNPTSLWSASQNNAEYWCPEVRPYLFNQRFLFTKHVELLGDIRVQPTASNPLSGAESVSMDRSGIVGHPRVQTKSVATPQSRMAKLMMTSGACTESNYSDTRVGRLGDFHHSLSAVLVEVDGSHFYARRLHFDKKRKSVVDLHLEYDAVGVGVADRALALIMGDTHVDFIDPKVRAATFSGDTSLCSLVQPKFVVHHDLLDGYSCNPHHVGNPFSRIAKYKSDLGNVAKEVERAIDFLRATTPKNAIAVVVPSNHNSFLNRWIMSTDWRLDPANAEFYLKTALEMAEKTKLGTGGAEFVDPFGLWVRKAGLGNVQVLDTDESFMLGGVELGQHGDRGPNGSRGSITNMRRIGVKSVIGHSHSPGEDEGCVQVGTSTALRLEYNTGPSSWLNAHCVLLANGKRQLITIVDGKFRL